MERGAIVNDALLGRYYAAESPVHRTDPRIKITCTFVLMGAIFASGGYAALGVCALFLLLCVFMSNIPLKQVLHSIVPLLFIVVITALINIFFEHGGDVLVQLGPIAINREGVHLAVFMGVRLTLLLLAASLLTLTTTTLDLTDAMESMLRPLARFGFPAHEFAMIMGIALRFLPQFVSELQVIRAAQASRGAHFTFNLFRGGVQSVSSLLVPLFTSAFRHAETLSNAMEARCYHGGEGRTKLKPLRLRPSDFTMVAAVAVLVCCVAAVDVLL